MLIPVYNQFGEVTYQEIPDMPQTDQGYGRPVNPDYGQPGGVNDPYLPAPPNTGWDQQSGTWHPDYGTSSGPVDPPAQPPPGSPPSPAPSPYQPPPSSGGGGGGAPAAAGPATLGALAGYAGPSSPQYTIGQIPEFQAPKFQAPPPFSYGAFQAPDPFQAPTGQDVLNEPGYDFRRQSGEQAARQFASSLGKLRTGGTLKDLINYNQNFASQEYGNVYDRKASEYDRGYGNKWGEYQTGYNNAANSYGMNYGVSRDTFDRDFQGAQAEYAPKLLDWQTRSDASREAGNMAFDRGWQQYVYGADDAFRRDAFTADNAFRTTGLNLQQSNYNTDDLWRRYMFGSDDTYRRERDILDRGAA